MTSRAKCYNCLHRGEVPGSAHSSCHHPATGNPVDQNPFTALVGLMGRRSGMTTLTSKAAGILNIRAAEQGVRRGWFLWPVNFDPVWLENCDGFTEKPALAVDAHLGGVEGV